MAKKSEGRSKVSMVDEAIAKLGWDASTASLQQYVLDTFGAKMSVPHVAQTKSNLRKKHGVKGKKRRRGRKPGSTVTAATAPAESAASISDIIAFVNTVKDWERKLGTKNIREVIKSVIK